MTALTQLTLSTIRKLPGVTYHMTRLLLPSNSAFFSWFLLTFTCFVIIGFLFGNNLSMFQISFDILCQIFTSIFTNFLHIYILYLADSEASHSPVAFRYIPLPNRHALSFVQFMVSFYISI